MRILTLFTWFLTCLIAHSYSNAHQNSSVNVYCSYVPKAGSEPVNEKTNYVAKAHYDDKSKTYFMMLSEYEKVSSTCKDLLKGKNLINILVKDANWPDFLAYFYPIKIDFGGVAKNYYESSAQAFGKSVDELRAGFKKYAPSFKIIMNKTESFSLPEIFMKETINLRISPSNRRVLYVAGLIATYAFKNNEANIPSSLLSLFDIMSDILDTKNNADTDVVATWINKTALAHSHLFKTAYFQRGVEYYPPSIFANNKNFKIKTDDDLYSFIVQSLNLVTNSLRNY